MELSGRRFSDYQVHSALLATLVFFPGWLFFRRWGGQRAGVWTLLLMLSPLIAQNTTFSWTKLPAAFFVLTGAHFLVEGLQNRGDRAARAAAFACLTLALLTHYSAGPWLLVWGLCYALWCLRSSRPLAALGELSVIATACVLLALTWFGWAAHTYGWRGTGEANTTAAYWKLQTPAERLGTLAGNTFNTLVPHPLRKLDTSGIAQSSKLGSLRDYWFTVYQLNLPLALGFGGLLVLLHRLLRPAPPGTARAAPPGLGPWPLSTIVLLGIATVTAPDRWGLCHIGLQPLVLLGLALIAAHLESAPRALVRVFSLLLCLDVAFGIVLHFWVQSLAWPAWLGGGPDDWTTASTLNSVAFTNHRYTLLHDYRTLAFDLSIGPALPAVLLACLLALVCAGLRQPKPPGLAALPRT
jgi:succinate dehydrogenase/fumarate reductase cytochrome b subunit